MTDSPLYRLPLDPTEQPILDRLLTIRDKLFILKQDRSTYVKSQDVIQLYNEVIEQVERLNKSRLHKRDEQNRVDTVLDDCFQLISLFFLTIGKNQEAPAVYSATSTVKRLLDHLREAGFFSPRDLESIENNLEGWQASVERGKESHSPQLVTLLEARIGVCRKELQQLKEGISKLDPTMMQTYIKLVSILRSLSACNTRSKYPASEVRDFHDQLLAIQAEIPEAGLVKEGLSKEEAYAEKLALIHLEPGVQPGMRVLTSLLARCLLWVEVIESKEGKIDEPFQDTYDKLRGIRDKLEQMNLTQAWSLRETDLYSYQRQLDRIDEARVDGNFLDQQGNPADLYAQRTLLYLLRKSYAFIYQYIVSSEPVSEALLPIYNQLLTLRRCLIEVKKAGGIDSPRELYPYSMKLSSIDNMRHDGKFIVGNDIPEGQGSVTALLSECFELTHELRDQAERGPDSKSEGEAAEVVTKD